ncbi:AMP-binding protein [Aliikangiella maris]|uniref:AMP-binding protein n=2 Tax=Aliikangiella maris TaxID=3162458 RepID=A0ABV3MTC0_9GAMM
MQNIKITTIKKVSSVDFVKQVFECYRRKEVFAITNESSERLAELLGPIHKQITPESGGGWGSFELTDCHDNTPAQIIFSSGTEGLPKAIVISHRALSDVTARLNNMMKPDSTIREYIGVPVTYSFGLGRCRAVAQAGGQFYIPENGFNLSEITRMLATDEINAISAVPSLWRILLSQDEQIKPFAHKVRWIEIGSQWMSAEEKLRMKQLFTNACIVQHYGLTEASRSTLLNISEVADEKLGSVGKAVGNVEVKINQDANICLRGDHLALGQMQDGHLVPLVDNNGWLATNDTGHFEEDFLYFDGRSDDLINCSGVKVSPELIEQAVNKVIDGRPVTIVGIKDEQRGEGFLVVKSQQEQSDESLIAAVHDTLLSQGINARASIKVQFLAELPKTETGKIKRKVIAQSYTPKRVKRKSSLTSVMNIYQDLFSGQSVTHDSTFKSLGGDSLNFVQASVLLEKYLGVLPQHWELLTVAELEKAKTQKSGFWTSLEMSIFLRALAIISVVLVHAGVEILSGPTFLLIFLVGFNMARFRLEDFKEQGAWLSFARYASSLLVPYYLLTLVYFAWNRAVELDVLLLYANLISAKITVIFPFWFVQILAQCFIIIGILFSFKSIRQLMRENAWFYSYLLLVGFIGIRTVYPFVWETAHLNDLVPIRFIAHIWLGWCIYLADSTAKRILMAVTGTVFAFIDTYVLTLAMGNDLEFKAKALWIVLGSVTLPFVRSIMIPRVFKALLNMIAEATFYIFIFNGILIYMFIHIFKVDSIVLAFFAGMVGSMVSWWILEKLRLPVLIWRSIFGRKQAKNH